MKNFIIHITFCLFLLLPFLCAATHNRAGEISFKQLDDLTIEIIITTYTKESSASADRDSIEIEWGDGTKSNISRINNKGLSLGNDIKKNLYKAQHTYPGRSKYTISFLDPNRIDNILNVDPPNSVDVPFYLQSEINLLNLNFQGKNNSVVLLQAPIDFACVNQEFIHNPLAYDEDGDSLSYELIIPLMDKGTNVPNYVFPNQIIAGLNNNISLDSKTGTFKWNSPQKAGEYNIAIIIYEYRKGVRIASTIRDMQILVKEDCKKNNPPIVKSIADTCIIAGTKLLIPFQINDIDTNRLGGKVKAEVYSAALLVSNPAIVQVIPGYQKPILSGEIEWQTQCNHISKQNYSISIKGTDNLYDTSGLIDLKIIQVKIIGPQPEKLTASTNNKQILLTWEYPYFCFNDKGHFQGFSVWRRETPYGPILDSCTTGLEKYNYVQIAYIVNTNNGTEYYFIDSTAAAGKLYCYRVQAEFAKLSQAGFPYDQVASLPSDEVCFTIPIEDPILLNVDIRNTNINNGEIFIKWQRPLLSEFDTLKYPGPYTIMLYRKTSGQIFSEIINARRQFVGYSAMVDTTFFDTNLNTSTEQYEYKLDMISGINTFSAANAQSIYLRCHSGNKHIELNWNELTPWFNYQYTVYKKNISGIWDSIGTTMNRGFTDKNVELGQTYCYLIKSSGEYNLPAVDKPLINFSNENCCISSDTIPPCCPILKEPDFCAAETINDSLIRLTLHWTLPELACAAEIKKIILVDQQDDKEKLLAEITDLSVTNYKIELNTISQYCFKIYGEDASGNRCLNPNINCGAVCPEYELPNTFTPNEDGQNDIFHPRKIKYIKSVDFVIENRWGEILFETHDPKINWDGSDTNCKKLNDGVYYYHLIIHSVGANADFKDKRTGFIEILASDK